MGNPGLRAPLRRPVFRRLAASYALNELGDWMGIVALSVLVFGQTDSALATAGLFLGTRFLPALLAPVLVARVERPPPRFALPAIYCGQAAAFGVLALLSRDFALAPVIAVAMVDGILALTGRALSRAVVGALLEPAGELRAGNAVLNVAFTGGAALGPGIAGVLVGLLGVQSALLLDAVSFYAIAWILLTAGPLPRAESEGGRVRDRVRAGLSYISGKTALRGLLIAQGLAFIFFAAVIPVEVIYAKQTLGTSDSGFGLLLASWGAGMVLGSIAFAIMRRGSLARLLFASTVAVGAGYLGIAGAPSLALACAASVFGGIGNGVQWVAIVSAVQELTAQQFQARVLSVLESVGAAMPGIGFLLGGIVTATLDPRAAYLVAGAGVLVVAFFAALLLGSGWEGRPGGRLGLPESGDEVMVQLRPRATRQTQLDVDAAANRKGSKSREESI